MFPRNHQLTLVGLVLKGKLKIRPDESTKQHALKPWTAVEVAGAGVHLSAEDDSLLAFGLATTTGALKAVTDNGKKAPWKVRWRKRPRTINFQNLEASKPLVWGKGKFGARIAFGGKGRTASWGILRAVAGSNIKAHSHPSWEHIAILSGHGTLTLGSSEVTVTAGKHFNIPQGKIHAYKGNSSLVAIQMYTPAGPEQRFVKLAKQD